MGSVHPMGPLQGVRVVELAAIGPVPWAGMVLADLGADVVRVDRPGDLLGFAGDVTERGKRSVLADVKTTEGLTLIRDLAAAADVLLEGMRPGTLERLGLAPADLHAANPALVIGRMTGWGQDGPLAPSAGHDITYVATSGVLGAIGAPGERPMPPINLLGDYAGGSMFLLVGILAAMHHARATGRGQVVDAAIIDGLGMLAAPFHGASSIGRWGPVGENLLDGGAPFYGTYRCADGRFVAVGPIEPQFFAEFVRRLGLDIDPVNQYDPTAWPALRESLTTAFAARSQDQWSELFEGTDACVAPVLSLADAPEHPHAVARGAFVDINGVRHAAPAPRFSRTPATIRSGPPVKGGHTEQVRADWGLP